MEFWLLPENSQEAFCSTWDFCSPTFTDSELFANADEWKNGWKAGATDHSNNVAEATAIAMLLSLLYILQEHIYNKKIVCHYDSEYAASTISGIYRPKTHKELIRNSQLLYIFVSTKCNWCWNKVKSHTGVVGNERVDKAAKMGAGGTCRVWTPQHFLYTMSDCCNTPLKRLRASPKSS